MVVLRETKDNKDELLNLCYPWVNTHGYQTSRSAGNTGNLAKMEKFGVLCNIHV